MRNGVKKALVVILCVFLAGFVYWQFIKKGVINNAIARAVSSGTDGAYYVDYESSVIDEVNGNASFKNVVLQSDSLQQQLLTDDTASIAKEIFNIKVGELHVSGANIPALLKKTKFSANKVEIINPVIKIIRTGKKGDGRMSKADSVELYNRITGKLKAIQANEVIVKNGTIAFANGKKAPHTLIEGINIHLKNLKVDSIGTYDNILGYFIKDVDADIRSVQTVNEKNGNQFLMEGVRYNAPGKYLTVNSIVQKDTKNGRTLIDLHNSRVAGISTQEFIINRKIKADSVSSSGGVLSIYRNTNASSGIEGLEIDNDFFDEVQIRNISMGNAMLNIYKRGEPNTAPLSIPNFRFAIHDIPDEVRNGSNLRRLISYSNWNFSGDGLSYQTDDNFYKVSVGPFVMDNSKTSLRLNKIAVTPLLSRAAFMQKQKFQHDQYDFQFNNVVLTGVDAQALINEQKILADNGSLQTILRVYNDRTLPYDTASKIGMYPHQMLYTMKVPIRVKNVRLHNSLVSYVERGRLSTQQGEVFVSNINGTISNLCNIKEELAKNNMLTLQATGNFMGLAALQTVWKLPVNTRTGAFDVKGEIAAFDPTKLNSIVRPLGMASIEKGKVKSARFELKGDDYRSNGKLLLLYNDLKVTLLKNTGEGKPAIRKKTVTSFLANLFMQDSNPMTGNTRTAAIAFDRDTKKSFFNLIWKSLFQGTKKVTKGKDDG